MKRIQAYIPKEHGQCTLQCLFYDGAKHDSQALGLLATVEAEECAFGFIWEVLLNLMMSEWHLLQEALYHQLHSPRLFPSLGSLDKAVLPGFLQQSCPGWLSPATDLWACTSLWLDGLTSMLLCCCVKEAPKLLSDHSHFLLPLAQLSLIHVKVIRHVQFSVYFIPHKATHLITFLLGQQWNFRRKVFLKWDGNGLLYAGKLRMQCWVSQTTKTELQYICLSVHLQS